MSQPLNFNQLNNMLAAGGQSRINYKTYLEIFEAADALDDTEDGQVTQENFMAALQVNQNFDQTDMSLIEDGYLSALAGLDGQDNISYNDIALSEYNSAQTSLDAANSANNYANSGEYQDRNTKTPVALQGTNYNNKTVDPVYASQLKQTDVDTLRTDRTSISDQIATERSGLEEAKAQHQEAIDTAESEYQQALDNINAYIGGADDENSDNSEEAQAYRSLLRDKDENDQNIQEQNSVISDLNNAVSSQNIVISSLEGQKNIILSQEPSEDQYKKTDENGEQVIDYAAFGSAHREWEAEADTIEQQIKTAQDELSQYEQQLGDAENALKVLEQNGVDLEAQITDAVNNLNLKTNSADDNENSLQTNLNNAKAALDEARTAMQTDIAQYEANIAQLQLNLSEYDTAISYSVNENTLNLEDKEGVERLGAYSNPELNAEQSVNDNEILHSNAAALELGEQEEYLKYYLGDEYSSENLEEGSNYYTKINDDGTKDCFRVVNDNGEIKLIHTNIPNEGDASTEIYGLDPLKDGNGEEKTYSKYASNQEGVLNTDQISALSDEIKDGNIPEDVDLTNLDTTTMKSLISEYTDKDTTGEDFINKCAELMSNDELKSLQIKLSETSDSMPFHEIQGESGNQLINAQNALKKITGFQTTRDEDGNIVLEEITDGSLDPVSDDGATTNTTIDEIRNNTGSKANEYLTEIDTLIENANAPGINIDISEDLKTIGTDILTNSDLSSDEALTLLEYIIEPISNANEYYTFDSSYFNNSYLKLMENTINSSEDVQTIIDMTERYKDITGQDDFFIFSTDNIAALEYNPWEQYTENVLSLLGKADTAEDFSLIEDTFTDFFDEFISRYSSDEDKYKELFNSINKIQDSIDAYSKDDTWKNNLASSGYGAAGKESTFKNILKNKDKFIIDKDGTLTFDNGAFIAALMWAAEADSIDQLASYYANLRYGVQNEYLAAICCSFYQYVE